MSRVRVSDLAKELGLETKAVLAHLNKIGVPVKNHLNMITDGEAAKLKSALHPGKNVTDKDSAQKAGSKIFIRRKINDTVPSSIIEPGAEQTQPQVEETVQKFSTENLSEEVANTETHVATDTNLTVATQAEPVSVSSEETQTIQEAKNELPYNDVVEHLEQENKVLSQTVAETIIEQSEQPVQQKQAEPVATPPVPTSVTPPVPPTPVTHPISATPRSTSGSATIVRRGPEDVYQVNMYKPAPRPAGGRPPYQGGTGYQGTNPRPASAMHRPGVASRPGSAPGGFSTAAPQKSFVTPDATPSSDSKNASSRFKERGKEREKSFGHDDSARNNKNRLKGVHFYEKHETIEDIVLDSDGSLERAINVRTITSGKKRRMGGPKRKESRTELLASNPTKASKKVIRIDEHISANDLANELSQKVSAVIKTLMKLGMFATANQILDFDTATLVAQEFGFDTQNVTVSLEDIITQKHNKQETISVETTRPPIITIMGHVDHGKTSLLDALRKTNVVASEAGGITQHIGAYQITYQDRKLTFLDTPGHEAFTAMRARGAQVTDIVILVVSADDGVMPQTVEAIAHAKAANVPIIVAINKIDKPGANIDRIMQELSGHGVLSEEWGGDSMFVPVSAKTGEGLEKLIESILVQADVLELTAPADGFAEGVVIEAKRDKSRGPVATVIVTKGLLKQQDSIVIGKTMGRVRAIFDEKGAALKDASPGTPVELIGLDNVPEAGDTFNTVANDAIAREAVAYRIEKHRQQVLASQKPTSVDDLMTLFAQRNESSDKPIEFPIIIKADTHGSSEAIKAAVQKLDTAKVKTKIVLSSIGGITETDVVLANASHALMLGFNVRPDKIAANRAESHGIKIMFFNIIYELIDAVKLAMAGSLAPIHQDKVLGHAEVRNLFTVPKVGVIAGCHVSDGKITRQSRIRVTRDSIVIYTGNIGSLKRFKDDAKEVMHGFECGISVQNYNDLKVGDILEAFMVEEIAATLE